MGDFLLKYVKEEDFKNVKELGFNVIRINFTCYNLTTDGYTINPKFFNKLDWAIDMAKKYNAYYLSAEDLKYESETEAEIILSESFK